MKKFIVQILQVPVDVVVGLATYYVCMHLIQTSTTFAVIISLIVTAIFAEVFEIKLKAKHATKK